MEFQTDLSASSTSPGIHPPPPSVTASVARTAGVNRAGVNKPVLSKGKLSEYMEVGSDTSSQHYHLPTAPATAAASDVTVSHRKRFT